MFANFQSIILASIIALASTEVCRPNELKEKTLFSPYCTEFDGDLYLDDFYEKGSNFSNLESITGSLILIGSDFRKLPKFSNLKTISSDGPAVIIINNEKLLEITGLFINSELKNRLNSPNDYFIRNNEQLDLSIYSKLVFKPFKPIISENFLPSGTDLYFAESLTLGTAIICFLTVATLFLYNASMGATNLYFIPGYHRR